MCVSAAHAPAGTARSIMSIYFDNNATTALDERVLDAMLPYLREHHANASSLHRGGRTARSAIDRAREQVAALVDAQPDQVIFTSGGTEANNMALKGLAAAMQPACLRISPVEHAAVLEPAAALQRDGWTLETMPVDGDGCVTREAFADAGAVKLASCMLANNETGVIQEVAALADQARSQAIILHCDAVQAAGKMPLSYAQLGVHVMTLSAHKIHGPKGIGALVVDRGTEIAPLLHGGGHEGGLRGGTENTAAIVGFGAAAELAVRELEHRAAHMRRLRDQLEAGLNSIPGVQIFATGAHRLPNTVQFAVAGYEGESLLMALDHHDIAVSSGSACESGSGEPSHVLTAMGIPEQIARGAIRVSFGKDNHSDQVDTFVAVLQQHAGGQVAMGGINPAVLGG